MSSDKGSTNFGRRTWDKEEYAKKAQERYENRGKPRDEATKISKYEFHKDREQVFQKIDEMNKVSFVSEQASAVSGKKGKGIGFYCEICDLTYKDDLELVDHLNSKQHFNNAGVEYIDKRDITLEMIIDRVEKLAKEREKREMESEEKFDLKKRIEMRKKFEQSLVEKRRLKKLKKKLKRNTVTGLNDNNDIDNNSNDNLKYKTKTDDMMSMMGFKGFGSTKAD